VRNRSAPPRRRWASVWARRASGDVSNGTSEVYLSGRLSSCPESRGGSTDRAQDAHPAAAIRPRLFLGAGRGRLRCLGQRHLQTRHSLSGSSAPDTYVLGIDAAERQVRPVSHRNRAKIPRPDAPHIVPAAPAASPASR
jgi:hypothetical protein